MHSLKIDKRSMSVELTFLLHCSLTMLIHLCVLATFWIATIKKNPTFPPQMERHFRWPLTPHRYLLPLRPKAVNLSADACQASLRDAAPTPVVLGTATPERSSVLLLQVWSRGRHVCFDRPDGYLSILYICILSLLFSRSQETWRKRRGGFRT